MTTLKKLAVARIASRLICGARQTLGLRSRVVTRRGGITWDLDLQQGFDLALYLFGKFEPGVQAACRRLCPNGGVILDVGANIGALTLPLAVMAAENGKVYAFEPTDFAFRKLLRNIALNPDLSRRIEAAQVFLGDGSSSTAPDSIPASWPLREKRGLDPLHGGRPETLRGAQRDTLDQWMARNNPARIDLIKLDVDGHETEVLRGAEKLLRRFRPPMVAEFAPDVFGDKPGGFGAFIGLLSEHGYKGETLSGKELPLDSNLEARIPRGSGLNAVLIAR